MRKLLFILPLLAMTGCGLMNPEYRSLNRDDPVVTAILASSESQDAKLAALSDVVGLPVLDYGAVGDDVVAKIQAPIDQAVDDAIREFAEEAPNSTSPIGLLWALGGAVLVGGGTLLNRTKQTGKK